MQINITLSKKEKRHYFIYLLAMLLLTVILLAVATMSRLTSPFEETDLHSVSILQEKSRFDETQKSFAKKTDSLFSQISKFDPEKASPIEENNIQVNISEVQNAFKLTNFTDSRKSFYPQVAEFYSMYYEDKKSALLIKENTKNLKAQLENCTVGYRNDRQEMVQRETRGR